MLTGVSRSRHHRDTSQSRVIQEVTLPTAQRRQSVTHGIQKIGGLSENMEANSPNPLVGPIKMFILLALVVGSRALSEREYQLLQADLRVVPSLTRPAKGF